MSSTENEQPHEKASKIPSWIMLGFILGGLAFYTLNGYLNRKPPAPAAVSSAPGDGQTASSQPQPKPDAAALAAAAQTAPLSQDGKSLSLFAIDAIFTQWSINALWDVNSTEVVFWNPATGSFSVPVEVKRYGEEGNYDYFYRLLDGPTRPVIREGVRPDAPILFTENDETTKRRQEKERDQWRWR